MEDIFLNLPYNSYEDLFHAVHNGKATIKLMRSDCLQIASVNHSGFANLAMYLGFCINIALLVAASIFLNNFWLLIWIPINFFLTSLILYTPHLKYIAWVVLIIDLFFIKMTPWLFVSAADVVIMSLCYNFWWNRTYRYAINELQYNQEAFLWAWNRNGLSIEDSYGNLYYNHINGNVSLKDIQKENPNMFSRVDKLQERIKLPKNICEDIVRISLEFETGNDDVAYELIETNLIPDLVHANNKHYIITAFGEFYSDEFMTKEKAKEYCDSIISQL